MVNAARPKFALLIAALGIVATVACEGGSSSNPPPETAAAPDDTTTSVSPGVPVVRNLQVYDQRGDGTTVVVTRVDIRGGKGFLVVHADQEGPGPVVGHAPINTGASADVVVPLKHPVATSVLWVMIHADLGTVGRYEWPRGPDMPVSEGKKIVLKVV